MCFSFMRQTLEVFRHVFATLSGWATLWTFSDARLWAGHGRSLVNVPWKSWPPPKTRASSHLCCEWVDFSEFWTEVNSGYSNLCGFMRVVCGHCNLWQLSSLILLSNSDLEVTQGWGGLSEQSLSLAHCTHSHQDAKRSAWKGDHYILCQISLDCMRM